MSTALQNPRFRNRHRPQYITGRGSHSNTVNYRRETQEPELSNSPPVQGIYSDHRTAVMLCSFMGTQTTVKTRNGSTYKGHTISFSDEGDIAMSDVRLDNNDNTQKFYVPGIIIPKDKFVVCKTNGVDLKGLYNSASADFTDSGIVSRINGSCDAPMKELQPFYDEDAAEITTSVTLDDPNDGWDSGLMFQANRDKFNVQSTYNEDLHEYTTKLPDPQSEGYEEKEKFAKKQAEAIEQSDSYQSRIAKELTDGDEEYLYSAVHRTEDSNPQLSRHQESNSNSGKINTPLSQKDDVELSLRNEAFRVQELKNSEVVDQKMSQKDSQQLPHHQKLPLTGPPPASSHTGRQKINENNQLSTLAPSSVSMADIQQSPALTSLQPTLPSDRRIGRGMETSPEERNKIGQSLHDFQKNFVLESNGNNPQELMRQEDTSEGSPVSSAASSSVATTPVMSAPETSLQITEQSSESLVKPEENSPNSQKSTLNPNAKEFKPKSQPVQVEAQSPSPQPHSSPHVPQMVHFPQQQAVLVPYSYFVANSQKKRATVSLGAGVVSDLAAHQVTGQPLLATQPPNMMYLQAAGQALPTAYQLYSPQIINPRMVAPGSINMAQAGQVVGIEQIAAQNQPQPVFVTAQQQPLHTPIPAHLHPQPVHAQAIPLPSSIQQSQSTHMPNPVPSPVQHQQQSSHHMPQPLPHHIPQGPPHSSATPQPAHYPQMTVNYTHGMAAGPRTSMSGQQSITAGHSPVSFISASQFAYNGGTAQYTFAPALQPQASQNSSHGTGPQPQYVIMPQPSTQVHPSLQQHAAQPYTSSSIPFQPQQHLMQVPPHIPPNHNSNPSQSSPHVIHPGMSVGMHQQVSNAQPSLYMQVPSTVQQFQHQQ